MTEQPIEDLMVEYEIRSLKRRALELEGADHRLVGVYLAEAGAVVSRCMGEMINAQESKNAN